MEQPFLLIIYYINDIVKMCTKSYWNIRT